MLRLRGMDAAAGQAWRKRAGEGTAHWLGRRADGDELLTQAIVLVVQQLRKFQTLIHELNSIILDVRYSKSG